MEALLSFVLQKPIDEKPSADPVHCPDCGHSFPNRGIEGTTLIGGGDGTWDGDPNHTWTQYGGCCSLVSFTRQTKSGNVWYTYNGGRVLRGMPNCFEGFIYTCAKCHGDVMRYYRELDGITPARSISYRGDGLRYYRTVWCCSTCGVSTETLYDYWNGHIGWLENATPG